MKFLLLALYLSILIFLTTASPTCCENCGLRAATLSEDNSISWNECRKKKVCTVYCSSNRRVFFDLARSRYVSTYEKKCIGPKKARVANDVFLGVANRLNATLALQLSATAS